MFVPEYSFLISDCVWNQYPVLSIISCLFGVFYGKMENQDLQSMYSRSHFTALFWTPPQEKKQNNPKDSL